MRELQDILTAADEIFKLGRTAILATVVRVDGSSYRLPGARMLIDSAGRRTGSVSGGCLEADVARRGRLLTKDDSTTLVRYDGSDDDVAWGFGLGCNGSIQIFIERLDEMPRSLLFIRDCFEQRIVGAMVTVFEVENNIGLRSGSRFMMTSQRVEGEDEPWMRSEAAKCLASGESMSLKYETGSGRAQALIEAVHPPMPLVIFGAGQDAVPLMQAAKSLGWHVTVWDRRSGYARADRFPEADAVSACDPTTVPLSADTAAIVMTHHYPDDRALLPMLLKSPARYIGMLGPRARTDRMLAEMAAEGLTIGAGQMNRLHAPVGLDLGAEGAEQVAVAIVAEILSTLNTRTGGPLRDRGGPIHQPAKSAVVSMTELRDRLKVPQ